MRPFEGIKVLDFTQALAGVFAAMYLSDFGAEVIKIERAGFGDQSREWGPYRNNLSAYYATFNRGKKSLSLDMRQEEGKEVIRKLVKECDIVLENFKVGVLDKLGLGYEEMKKINPEIIYCSVSGFGLEGPLKDLPCYDIVAAARSGLMDTTGKPGNAPTKPGFSIGDNWTGLNLLYGATMALYYKQKTGKGLRLNISMLDSLFYMLEWPILKYSVLNEVHERSGNHDTTVAPYGVYKAQDGHIALAVASHKHWVEFCKQIGRPELVEDERFVDDASRVLNLEALIAIIEEFTTTKTKTELQNIFLENGVPAAAVLNIPEVLESEQLKERDMIVEINQPCIGKLKMPGIPIKFSKTPGKIDGYAPMLGENTEDILREIGYTDEKIKELYKNSVI